jgi:anti-anti-sigma factor
VALERPHDSERGDPVFGCTVRRRGLTSAIELEGELDLAAKATLEEAIERALEPGPVETIVIDFTGVIFADSTTLAWLVAADARIQEKGGRLVAVARPGVVLELLRLTGLDRLLTLVRRRRAARTRACGRCSGAGSARPASG